MALKIYRLKILFLTILFLELSPAHSQIADSPDDTVAGIPANYTEAEVGQYTLPDPLIMLNGLPVKTADDWKDKRRAEIVGLFEQHQFGVSPAAPQKLRYEVFEKDGAAFDGMARREQISIYFSADSDTLKMDLLVYLPVNAKKAVPMLLYISFRANSVAVEDPGIKEGMIWNREGKKIPASEGRRFFKPLDPLPILEQGFGFATVYYGDIEPDLKDGAKLGLRGLLQKDKTSLEKEDSWGAIAAWSWGLSRALDYFEEDPMVDEKRVAIMGVSRLGKTVLWAGALDQRFAMVIPVCSGESGAALSRRNYGETVAHIAHPSRYKYWFAPRYFQYSDNVNGMPLDAHMLIALIAPRPLLLITGNRDKWSDPYGEFLAAVAAEPVYELLAKEGLNTGKMPAAGTPLLNDMGFYLHDGGHGLDSTDWKVSLDFMEKHLQP